MLPSLSLLFMLLMLSDHIREAAGPVSSGRASMISVGYYTGYGSARSYSEFTVRSCTFGKYKTIMAIGDGFGIKSENSQRLDSIHAPRVQ